MDQFGQSLQNYLADKRTDIMKVYFITDEQELGLEQNRQSLAKTLNMCDLMLDIAAEANDIDTFGAALDLASAELDRLEFFFDSPELSLI
jgi:hypothetical protein